MYSICADIEHITELAADRRKDILKNDEAGFYLVFGGYFFIGFKPLGGEYILISFTVRLLWAA